MHTETPDTTTAAQDYRRSYRRMVDIFADTAKLSRQMARDESEAVTEEHLRDVIERLADLVDNYVADVIRIINLHAELEEKTKEAEQWQATASALHAYYGGWDPEGFEPGGLADLDDLGADESEAVPEEHLRDVIERLADLVDNYVDDVIRIINLHAELEEKTKEAEQWQATASALHAYYGGWDPEGFEPGVLADLDDLGAD